MYCIYVAPPALIFVFAYALNIWNRVTRHGAVRCGAGHSCHILSSSRVLLVRCLPA
jgi:hypothetical protein